MSSRNLILEIKINQKPLSANKMHYMKFKRDTKEYKEYKSVIADLMRGKYGIKSTDRLRLSLICGYSSKLSDLDNAFKPLLDSMQQCMDFDDRQIFEIQAMKAHTKKTEEYIMIRLEKIPMRSYLTRLKNLFPSFLKEKDHVPC